MPALPSPGKVIRIDHIFNLSEDTKAKCHLFYGYTGSSPSVAQLETMATALLGYWTSGTMSGLLANEYSLDQILITDLSSDTGAVASESGPVAGTRGSTFLPASTSLLTSWSIGRRYRGGHPRTYWPFGIDSDLQDGQTWKDELISSAQTAFTDYLAGIVDSVWPGGGSLLQVAVSFYQGFRAFEGSTGRWRNINTPRTVPLVDDVTNFIVQHGIAQLRKRLLGLA
jgi:hypothetical protein